MLGMVKSEKILLVHRQPKLKSQQAQQTGTVQTPTIMIGTHLHQQRGKKTGS